eukprot:CCRYP_017760-RA/>CCRYP_017760-RA protein AED:0.51 eAED:0.51 QI:0/-1/0/1/-1/0/1/0/347
MQYYTFELDEESQDLCTIITPRGKYKYARLPMGLKCSLNIAQSIMESVLSGIEDADVYIDDIGAFSHDWDHHVKLLATTLQRLWENGFTINPLKCKWAVQETDWLSYWLTPRGLKPQKKKIGAILHMDHPRNATKLRMFIGCVNYYRDMWPSRAHIRKPLTDQSGLKKGAPIKWTDKMQQAFDKMRSLMAANALGAYPDHNERFDNIHRCVRLPVGSLHRTGRKAGCLLLSKAVKITAKLHCNGERNALYCSYPRRVQGNAGRCRHSCLHQPKNLTFNTLKTQRVLCWHNKVKEFSPTLHYIEGPCNILADNLSWLHCLVTPAQIAEGKSLVAPAVVSDEEDEGYTS